MNSNEDFIPVDFEGYEGTQKPDSSFTPVDFDDYKPPSFVQRLKDIPRVGAQLVSRGAETALGLPGDILRLGGAGIEYGAKKLAGKDLELEKTAPFKVLPSSQQLRQVTNKLTKGYTEPQSETEESLGDITGLATSLALPDPGKLSKIGKAIGLATAAVGGKEAVKAFGGGEKSQAAAELGTIFLGSAINPKGVQNYLSGLYDSLKSFPAAKSIIPTRSLEKGLSNLRSKWTKGGTDPADRAALSKLDELEKLAAKGNVEVDELLEGYKKINGEIASRKLFEELNKGQQVKLRKNFDDIKGEYSKVLKANTPEDFYNRWASANEGWSAFAKSRRISDWASKYSNQVKKALGHGLAMELLIEPQAVAGTVAGLGAAGGALYAGTKTYEMLHRISNSRTLRKYYAESLKHIMDDNTPAALKTLEQLRTAIEKEDSK